MMMKMLDVLLGLRRLTLTETDRAIVLKNGRFDAILGPGMHKISTRDTVVEAHNINRPLFTTPLDAALFRQRPDLAEAHLLELRTGEGEVAVVTRDGRAFDVMKPETRLVFWKDAGPWTVERIDAAAALEVEAALGLRLTRAGLAVAMAVVDVPEGHVGLLTVDGVQTRVLPVGTHRFWAVGRKIAVKLVDTRWRTRDVTGQEILTKDRVTLRVNLSADFRVTDPLRAVAEVKDFDEALHRALQLAFRKTLGAVTLDALLADKVSVDAEAAGAVRTEMARVGIEVGEIALKDVILPGEMRDILNRVVTAQKEAEANVIRRRDDADATRALLNTAKVMADNPVMLRLKELEALQGIAGKVERLTVHNGTAGLMTDLVRLRD
jgi:regulator of protease activity HflC (stomatin/prohibitin superfamily)